MKPPVNENLNHQLVYALLAAESDHRFGTVRAEGLAGLAEVQQSHALLVVRQRGMLIEPH
jgi:hypothetical protein